jgi:hypothetical protein
VIDKRDQRQHQQDVNEAAEHMKEESAAKQQNQDNRQKKKHRVAAFVLIQDEKLSEIARKHTTRHSTWSRIDRHALLSRKNTLRIPAR